jgi:hypothetical protein
MPNLIFYVDDFFNQLFLNDSPFCSIFKWILSCIVYIGEKI